MLLCLPCRLRYDVCLILWRLAFGERIESLECRASRRLGRGLPLKHHLFKTALSLK